jgi:membrane protein implicated in regulation of membrane protease activity
VIRAFRGHRDGDSRNKKFLQGVEPNMSVSLYVYIGSLCFGAVFLMASLFLGGDSHGDAHADGDIGHDMDGDVDAGADMQGDLHADADGDADHGADHPHENLWDHSRGGHAEAGLGLAWFPIVSMRFWVFFLTFFGAAGALLQGLQGSEPQWTLGVSAVFGYVIGALAVNLTRQARRMSASTMITRDELVGKVATVVLPIVEGKAGKIRVQTRAGEEEFIAVAASSGDHFQRHEQARVARFDGARAVVSAIAQS